MLNLRARATKRSSWAPLRCGQWSRSCCSARISSAGPRLSTLVYSGAEEDHPAAVAFGHCRLLRGTEVYAIAELIRRQRGRRRRRSWARCRRARETHRSRSTRTATWIIWWRPTPSAWGSISMSITSPLHSDRKFDGYQFRKLNPAELASDRGTRRSRHARRYLGTTGRCAVRSSPNWCGSFEKSHLRTRPPFAVAQQQARLSPRSVRCRLRWR